MKPVDVVIGRMVRSAITSFLRVHQSSGVFDERAVAVFLEGDL